MTGTPTFGTPIVMLGLMHRTGTHLLYQLLLCHEQVVPVAEPEHAWSPRWEDALLRHAPLLDRYADRTVAAWHDTYRTPARAAALRAGLGRGITSFLEAEALRTLPAGTPTDRPLRVLTKQPTVDHLDLLPTLLPDVRPILVVRDGRSVTASGHAGFGWTHERGMQVWRRGARTILEALAAPGGDRHLVVRYEDLLTRRDETMAALFEHVGLDPAGYDARAAAALPVLGSSFHHGDGDGVNWSPVDAPPDFSPLDRWRDWPAARLERFAWVAGREARALGYDVGTATPSLRHRVDDWRWRARHRVGELVRGARTRQRTRDERRARRYAAPSPG